MLKISGMNTIRLKDKHRDDKSIVEQIGKINEMLRALAKRALATSTVASLNQIVEEINKSDGAPKVYKKILSAHYLKIKSLIKKEEGLVFKGDLSGTGLAYGTMLGCLAYFFGIMRFFWALILGLLGGLMIGQILENQAKSKGNLVEL